jgi:hypothetical protein
MRGILDLPRLRFAKNTLGCNVDMNRHAFGSKAFGDGFAAAPTPRLDGGSAVRNQNIEEILP